MGSKHGDRASRDAAESARPGAARALWKITRTAACGFVHERGPEAAAGTAFFTVFSLFPLLLILIALSGALLERVHVQDQILDTLIRFIPVSQELIRQNMVRILASRGTVGAIGILAVIWSASSAATLVVRNVNRAWHEAPRQNVLRARLAAILIVGGLALVLTLFFLARTMLNLFRNWIEVHLSVTPASQTTSGIILYVFVAMVLTFMYFAIPRTKVRWREAAPAGFLAAAAIWVTTNGFTWYVNSGLARYNVVYGSLGALLALLTWVYLASAIIFFGAHVSAAVAAVTRHARARDACSDS